MRPQRIFSNLSVNVIIHLEVKLNYGKILVNGWNSKGKRASVISLIAKSKESDTVFMTKTCMRFTAFLGNIWVEITAFLTNFYIWNTAFSIHFSVTKNALSSQHQVPWKQCVLSPKQILCFEFGCPYVHPDGKFRPRVFKLISMD